MKYALLIYSQPGSHEALSEEEYQAALAEYMAISSDPRCEGGAQLQPVETATTVRVRDGQPLTTDGPFADTKEVFGGYFVVEAGDLDEALDLAARVPAARLGGAVEVRPVVER
ncbi:MAG TPA: YciI family protein [Solirubrobacteraceae bacterium]|nr:YciI family protein [Solirubrobacteraceae bacterium]